MLLVTSLPFSKMTKISPFDPVVRLENTTLLSAADCSKGTIPQTDMKSEPKNGLQIGT